MTEAREAILRQAAEAAIEHLAALPDRAVAPTPAALAALAALPSAVPEHGRDASEVLRELAEVGGPAMHASGGGRYFGFVTGGSLPVAAAADWLTTVWDQNAWSAATSPGAAMLERKAVAGLLATLGLPGEGALCSGATGANIIALAAARDAVLAAAGWDVAAEGLVGAPPVAVYVGAEAHSSVRKALGVVGLGRSGRGKHVTTLATDPAGAVRAGAFAGLPPPAGPAIVVLQAGHVNTRAFDDFAAAVAWARAGGAGRRVWVHVRRAVSLLSSMAYSACRVDAVGAPSSLSHNTGRRRFRALGRRVRGPGPAGAGARRRRGRLVGDRPAQDAERAVRERARRRPRRPSAAQLDGLGRAVPAGGRTRRRAAAGAAELAAGPRRRRLGGAAAARGRRRRGTRRRLLRPRRAASVAAGAKRRGDRRPGRVQPGAGPVR